MDMSFVENKRDRLDFELLLFEVNNFIYFFYDFLWKYRFLIKSPYNFWYLYLIFLHLEFPHRLFLLRLFLGLTVRFNRRAVNPISTLIEDQYWLWTVLYT